MNKFYYLSILSFIVLFTLIFTNIPVITAQVPLGCAINYHSTVFADVTGDGKTDAIVNNYEAAANIGGITVRRSDGSKFLPNETWISVPYFGTLGTYFADVTGDGKADAIVNNYDAASNTGGITVRRSDGSKFLPNETWINIPYFGNIGYESYTYFADVTGDGKADAIVNNYDTASNTGGITVRRSDGSKFLPNETWINIPYFGNLADDFIYFADVTGDGKADAIVNNYDAASNTGGITVRRSDGSKFLPNETWINIPYFGNHDPMFDKTSYFADVTGDGKADAIVNNYDATTNTGGITVRRSDGSKFLPNETWINIPYFGTIGDVYFADVTGDGKADAIVNNYDATTNTGGITVRRSDGSKFLPNETWINIPYFGNYGYICLN